MTTQKDRRDDEPMTERESLHIIAEALLPDTGDDHLDVVSNINYITGALERIADALEKIAAKLG